MKRIILVLAIIAGIGLSANAQTYLIPKAGATFSNLKLNNDESVSGRTGFAAGLGLALPLAPDGFFAIQPELLYIQKGAKFKTNSASGTFVGETSLNYFELPVLAKISFGGEAVKAYVNAGPSIAYALQGRSNDTDISFGNSNATFNNRMDFGLQFGGGLGFGIGAGNLLLDLRYGMGLSNLLNQSVAGADSEAQNRTYALTLGYAIPLGGK